MMGDPPEGVEFGAFSVRELRDGRVQNEIARKLREREPADVLDQLKALANRDGHSALRLARRLLQGERHVALLFRFGIDHANASTINDWISELKCVLPLERIIDLLFEVSQSNPEAVTGALYWLPGHVSGEADEANLRSKMKLLSEATAPADKVR